MRSFHKQADAVPYPYEATILATSSQHLREFQLTNDRWFSPKKTIPKIEIQWVSTANTVKGG